MRVSKAPEERKQEILRTAMRLFTQQGYENTSMRDIAREMNVVQGLCYRYFDSKQKLFEEAMDTYAEECCASFIRVLHDPGLSLEEKLDWMFESIKQEGLALRYEEFFHKPENEDFHRQLAMRLCEKLKPHLIQELNRYAQARGKTLKFPSVTVDLITYCLLYTSPSPRDRQKSRMPSSA